MDLSGVFGIYVSKLELATRIVRNVRCRLDRAKNRRSNVVRRKAAHLGRNGRRRSSRAPALSRTSHAAAGSDRQSAIPGKDLLCHKPAWPGGNRRRHPAIFPLLHGCRKAVICTPLSWRCRPTGFRLHNFLTGS
jgi:hypothetical protein